jgi:hypothetical protein
MTQFEIEMLDAQERLIKIQKERNEILKSAFVIHDGAIPALEKLVMEIIKIKYILENGI